MDYYNLFVQFLREHRCESAFNENFHTFNRYTVFCRDIWGIMGADEYFLNRAFDWSKTPQGRGFWKNLDVLWEKVYLDTWRAERALAKAQKV